MSGFLTLSFNNQNSLRAYPVREACSQVSSSGVSIPQNFICDAQFQINSDPALRLFISSITNVGTAITVAVSQAFIRQGETQVTTEVVGSFYVATTATVSEQTFVMTPSNLYPNAQGRLVVYGLDWVDSYPYGETVYTLQQAEFEPRVVQPSVVAVNRLLFTDTQGRFTQLTGDVYVYARNNMRIKRGEGQSVYLDAGDGLGLNAACDTTTPIKTINHISPDQNGNFQLTAQQCITITPGAASIALSDSCGSPCPTCANLDQLVARTTALESNILSLRDSLTSMNSSLLGIVTGLTLPCSNC